MKKKIRIPINLDDCFSELDKISNIDSFFGENEVDFVTSAHFSLGRWIRNEWGLWDDKSNSHLRQYFIDKKIIHADDMSGIILTSYYRYLKNIDLNLDEQIDFYIEYYMSDEEKKQFQRKRKLKKLK